jgi:hypothetical protein
MLKPPTYHQSPAEWYTPGNIILNDYWRTYDEVVEFVEEGRGSWYVKVREVKQSADGVWMAVGPVRVHATYPNRRDRLVA